MKKFITIILISLIFLGIASFASADNNSSENIEIYFFYGSTCPVCKKVDSLLEEFKIKYSSLKVNSYEVFGNKENAKLFSRFLSLCGEGEIIKVPRIFIGDKVIKGYLNEEMTSRIIKEAIDDCLKNGCSDVLDRANQCAREDSEKNDKDQVIDYPLIGKINLSKMSLPVLTVLMAALDGFNPCAMWVLLFLIALLINVKSRKKMWIIGGTFIAVSGVVYYLLLAAWLNLFLAISYVSITRIIIGFFAVALGFYQIKNFIVFKPGVCKVAPVGSKWNERLSNKVKQIVQSKTLPATILGIIILAFGVNFIEFFCSAGLPAIYTNILSLSNLNSLTYYLYLLLYTVIFMIDDLIIFSIAIITLSKIGFTEKYTKWSMLIGGLLIFILGMLLIFKPNLLMFG